MAGKQAKVACAGYDIDPATGLPEVPENYRWKVRFVESEYRLYPTLTVALQKKGRAFWKTLEDASYRLGWENDPTKFELERMHKDLVSWRGYKYALIDPSEYPEYILDAANKVLIKQARSIERETWDKKLNETQTALAGTYPPKSLKQ